MNKCVFNHKNKVPVSYADAVPSARQCIQAADFCTPLRRATWLHSNVWATLLLRYNYSQSCHHSSKQLRNFTVKSWVVFTYTSPFGSYSKWRRDTAVCWIPQCLLHTEPGFMLNLQNSERGVLWSGQTWPEERAFTRLW